MCLDHPLQLRVFRDSFHRENRQVILSPMNLFALPGCELYGGKEQSILFIIISAVVARAVLHFGPSESSCWVVTMRFSPQLRSSPTAAQGRFSGNLPTIFICDMGMKVPMSWSCETQERRLFSAQHTVRDFIYRVPTLITRFTEESFFLTP